MEILVVDDDPVGLVLASSVVESLGHTARTALDGEQAWQLLSREHVDVVISDRDMPGLDGLELCRRLRGADGDAATTRPYTYVVLLTAHDAHEDALQGMQAGVDDYLGKPLDARRLQLRLLAAERVTDLHARLRRKQAELEALNADEHAQARRDPLTGLANRRALQEDLDRLDASGGTYALGLLDLDHFTAYNQAVGHVAGDAALRTVAEALAAHLLPGDEVYRYGGQELVHVVRGPDPRAAVERLRACVRGLGLAHPTRSGQVLTASAGLAVGSGTPWRQLLAAADTALYDAKRAGCDQTAGHPHRGGGATGPAREPEAAVPLLEPAPLQEMHELGQRIGRGLAEEVVRTYLRQSDDRVAALQAALDTRACEELVRGAHALRGSSATIGATAVSQVCAELERAQRWERRAQLVDRLHTLAGATDEALVAHLETVLRSSAA